MAIWYAKAGIANWDTANGWNSQADGLGTDATHPLPAGDTADLNGRAVTLNVDVTIALIQATTGTLTVSGTRTITGNVTYSGTSTGGMVIAGSGATITINGQLSNSSSGYALVSSGTAVVVISNVGGTACNQTGSGRCVYHTSSGSLTVTGAVATSNGNALDNRTSACTITITGNMTSNGSGNGIFFNVASTVSITGDVSASSTGSAVYSNGGTTTISGAVSSAAAGFGLYAANGTITVAGEISATNGAFALQCSGGTVTWIGARTVAADCGVWVAGGTLALATASGALTLTSSGVFVIRKTGGTLTLTSNGNNASFVRQVAAAQIACLGQDISAYVVGPTLPAAGDVDSSAAQFGYAGSLVSPTFAVPPIARVESGYQYGAGGTEYTGALAGGGYTYGDEDPAQVLTTAAGAGTYNPALYTLISGVVAPQYVLTGHDNYTGGSSGTLTLPAAGYVLTAAWGGPATYGVAGTGSTPTATLTAAANVYHTADAFGAAGSSITPAAATYSEGLAIQLASDVAAVTAGAADILDTAIILGVAGTFPIADYCEIAAITWPASAEVDGGVQFGPVTGTEYEGTGVNQTTLEAVLDARGITTGNVAQTGDSFARLGEPSGASIAADIAAIDPGTGSGARTVTPTVNDGTSPLEGARIRFTKGAESYVGTTNASGQVTSFNLDDGTWTVAVSLSGYTFAGTTLVVDGNKTPTYSMTAASWPASTEPNTVTVRWLVKGDNRQTVGAGEATVYVRTKTPPTTDGIAWGKGEDSDTTDANGYVYFADVPVGCTLRVRLGATGEWQDIVIPDGATSPHDAGELLGVVG